jgi:hypothetical protein
LKIIQNLAGKRLHPEPVAALMAVYGRGEIRIQRFSIKRPVAVADVASNVIVGDPAAPLPPMAETASLEKSRV